MNGDILISSESLINSLFAYVGPGADLGLISSVIGLLLTLGASTVFIVLMPVRAAWRRLRGKSDTITNDDAAQESASGFPSTQETPQRRAA